MKKIDLNRPTRKLYAVKVYAYSKYKGERFKEVALNTRLYGESLEQVKRDVKKQYGSKWIVKVTYLGYM